MTHGPHGYHVQHINDAHADDLLAAARAFGGYPDATAARAERVDRDGIDLVLDTPRGRTEARVRFTEPVAEAAYPDGLRAAFMNLTRRARTALATDAGQTSTA